jgi:lysyl endopeptidase
VISRALFAVVLALATLRAGASVPGEDAWAEPKKQPTRLKAEITDSASTATLILSPLPATKAVPSEDIKHKRTRIGARRDLVADLESTSGPAPGSHWDRAADGGWVTRIAVASPGALALRLGIRLVAAPAGAELRFRGTNAMVIGPIPAHTARDATHEQGVYWSPVTEGGLQTVELWIPASADPGSVKLEADAASHLVVQPSSRFKASGIGAAGTCHEDVACVANTNAAVARAARAVAKMVYTENGMTYLCTGTLVNDADHASQVPYFHTAAHCVGTQAAASTLNTFWFYEASACPGKSISNYKQLPGGARLLHANADTDVALVRLADRAPGGAWFAGWDEAVLPAGTPLVAIHHPAGDLKKVAMGTTLAPTPSSSGSSYSTVAWLSGTTEPGSSGSGLFTLQGGDYVLRGGLKSGSASCANTGRPEDPSNRDYYSRIDLDAVALRTILASGPAPLEDYTDMWSDPAEAGWGLSIQQHLSNKTFVTWFAYDVDGLPTWFVMTDPQWTSAATLEGSLYRTTGTAWDQPWQDAKLTVMPAGTGRIDFGYNGAATATLTVDGRTVVKSVRRQAY